MTLRKFYAMEKQVGEGVPIFFNAVLAEKYDESNPMPEMNYEWCRRKGENPVDFPEKLFLICKEKLLNFDYITYFKGFIVSEVFLNIFKKYSSMLGFQEVPLIVISYKGQSVTDKKYYYLSPYKKEKWVDYEQSQFTVLKGKKREDVISSDGAFIEKFQTILLKETEINQDVFPLKGSLLTRYLFCSDLFKTEIEKENLVGINFIRIEELPEHYNEKFMK